MPCLAVALALIAPRITIIVLWLLTHWFRGIFDSMLWPILGFIFMPMTLLWYTAVQHWFGGAWTFWPIVGVVIAVLIDIAPARANRKER